MCEFTVDCNFCRETNLKVRQALPSTAAMYDYVDQLGNFDGMCSIFLYMYPTCNGKCILCSTTLYLMVYVTWLLVCVCGGGGGGKADAVGQRLQFVCTKYIYNMATSE